MSISRRFTRARFPNRVWERAARIFLVRLAGIWASSDGALDPPRTLFRIANRAVIVAALLGAFAACIDARLRRSWTHAELLAESDFVALIEPVLNQPTKDVFTIEVDGGRKINYKGIDTRFRVDLVFKADSEAVKELTVLHFSDEDAESIANGPNFIYFPIGPLQYEKRFSKDGEELAKMTVYQGEPLLLAFLKRRPDGRYEPVTGQEDPDESFFEIHKPSFPHP